MKRYASLAILGAGLLGYLNSFSVPFVFDDHGSIEENPHIRSLRPLSHALQAPKNTAADRRPVVALSLALNHLAGGMDVRGYHAVNLAVHLAAALLLYGLVRRTLRTEPLRGAFGARSDALALGAALLWVVHPLHTESVTYISTRTESMAGLFYLAALYAFVRGAEGGGEGGGEGGKKRWWAASIASCFLGMGTKEVMVSAPLAIYLFDSIFLCRGFREPLRKRGWVYAGLAASWIPLAFLVLSSWGRILDISGVQALDIPWTEYVWTQFRINLHYLRLVAWPHPLIVDYCNWPSEGWLLDSGKSLAFAGLGVACAWAAFRRKPLGFVGAWCFLVLAPTILFPQPMEIAAERRTYLPSMGILLAAAVGVERLLNGLREKFPSVRPMDGALRAWVLLFPVSLLSVATLVRNHDYRDELELLLDTVSKRPGNPRAQYNLGTVLVERGKLDEGIARFREAVRLEPRYADACNSLGSALAYRNRTEEAIFCFRTAIRKDPSHPLAHYNLAASLEQIGRQEEAAAAYQKAVRWAPDWPPPLEKLAWILATSPSELLRDGAKSVALARRALELSGAPDPQAVRTLAAACAEAGDFKLARENAGRALALARSRDLADLAGQIERDLALYERGVPLRCAPK